MSKAPHKVYKLKVPQPVYKAPIDNRIDPMIGEKKTQYKPVEETASIFLKDEIIKPKKQNDIIVAQSTVKKSNIDLTRGNKPLIPT